MNYPLPRKKIIHLYSLADASCNCTMDKYLRIFVRMRKKSWHNKRVHFSFYIIYFFQVVAVVWVYVGFKLNSNNKLYFKDWRITYGWKTAPGFKKYSILLMILFIPPLILLHKINNGRSDSWESISFMMLNRYQSIMHFILY